MKFIFGYKQEMTQIFKEDGTVVPVTIVKADPCVITQVRTSDKDGYTALQVGFGAKNKASKSVQGHLKPILATGRKAAHKLQEVRVESTEGFNVGDLIDVSNFDAGDKVQVTGTSKGKGFQGVVKRHGFGGSPASHGHKDQLRMPGSIGAQEPQRVFKGTRMGGRMGAKAVTVKNLEVVQIDSENNLIFVKGALPGARNSAVLVKADDGDIVIGGNIFETKKVEETAKADVSSEASAKDEDAPKEAEAPKEEAKEETPAAAPEEKAAEAGEEKSEDKKETN